MITIFITASILDKVVHCLFVVLGQLTWTRGDVAPRVLANDCSMIGSVDNSIDAWYCLFTLEAKDLCINKDYPGSRLTITASDTSHTYSIIIDGCNGAGYVGTMVRAFAFDLTFAFKLLSLLIHNKGEASIKVYSPGKVFVLIVNTSVHHTDYYLWSATLHLPSLF